MESSKKKNAVILVVVALLILFVLIYLLLFSNKDYKVTFDTNGGTVMAEKTVKKGTKINEIEVPTKEGYKFLYWTIDGKVAKSTDEIDKDVKLVAIWEVVKKNVVTFDTDGGSLVSKQEVEEGGFVTKPIDPTKDGYVFDYWTLNGARYTFGETLNSDITLKAVWKTKEEKPKIETYTVTFNSDGGSSVKSQTVEKDKTATKPASPTKSGYKFVSWQLDGKDYDFGSKVTKDITLKAVWEKTVTYTVTFNSDGGSSVKSQTVEKDKTVTKPTNPTKSGYKFVSWQLDGKDYNFNSKVTANITLKAKWQKLETYTVTFNSNGGTSVSDKQVVEGNKVSKPSNPTREGYNFNGWTLNGKSYDFNKAVTGNITLVASWTQKSYTVEVTLVDSATNPARKLVVKQGSTVINDAKAIKTIDGVVIDNSAPFTVNSTVVDKLGSQVIVVLSGGTEVKAQLKK